MKKLIAFLLACTLLLCLCACGNKEETPPETTTESALDLTATDADKTQLENLYTGKTAYHGQLHDHAKTGGNSDGKNTLTEWKEAMQENKVDFTTIVDHKQTLHMTLEEWDDTIFIGGSEPGGRVSDLGLENNGMHYNMIFADLESFEEVLNAYPTDFMYAGYLFNAKNFTKAKFIEIFELVREKGGFYVHVHPKLQDKYIVSDDPLDYFFVDYAGLEVMTSDPSGDMSAEDNKRAYQLWVDLLNLDKHLYATFGSDSHRLGNTYSLSTFYSTEQKAQAFVDLLRAGNFTAGPVGIRMSVGDTATGGATEFAGKRLVVAAGDFHELEFKASNTYRIDIYDETGLVASQDVDLSQTVYLAMDASATAKYYRANVYDVTEDRIIAVGNPIWNEKN